jgi:hypothetical protein
MAHEDEGDGDNPLRDLADIINHRVASQPRPRPETDRRTNYRMPPTPPGVDLAATSVEDSVRRDPDLIESVYETARATTPGTAVPWSRPTIRPDVSSATEILDYLDQHRGTLHRELVEQIDATADRVRRNAWASLSAVRLTCPHCGHLTVLPKPDLSVLICIDYACAPKSPRVIDPAAILPADRRYSVRDLALIWHMDEAALRKKLWRHKIQPVHVARNNRHLYRWGDVEHLAPRGVSAAKVA